MSDGASDPWKDGLKRFDLKVQQLRHDVQAVKQTVVDSPESRKPARKLKSSKKAGKSATTRRESAPKIPRHDKTQSSVQFSKTKSRSDVHYKTPEKTTSGTAESPESPGGEWASFSDEPIDWTKEPEKASKLVPSLPEEVKAENSPIDEGAVVESEEVEMEHNTTTEDNEFSLPAKNESVSQSMSIPPTEEGGEFILEAHKTSIGDVHGLPHSEHLEEGEVDPAEQFGERNRTGSPHVSEEWHENSVEPETVPMTTTEPIEEEMMTAHVTSEAAESEKKNVGGDNTIETSVADELATDLEGVQESAQEVGGWSLAGEVGEVAAAFETFEIEKSGAVDFSAFELGVGDEVGLAEMEGQEGGAGETFYGEEGQQELPLNKFGHPYYQAEDGNYYFYFFDENGECCYYYEAQDGYFYYVDGTPVDWANEYVGEGVVGEAEPGLAEVEAQQVGLAESISLPELEGVEAPPEVAESDTVRGMTSENLELAPGGEEEKETVSSPEEEVKPSDEVAKDEAVEPGTMATEEPTTAVPTTTEEPTATKVPTTTEEPTVTEVPTTTEEPTVTEMPTTTEEPTTTAESTVVEVPTTTEEPTVTEEPTTKVQQKLVEKTDEQEGQFSEEIKPTNVAEPGFDWGNGEEDDWEVDDWSASKDATRSSVPAPESAEKGDTESKAIPTSTIVSREVNRENQTQEVSGEGDELTAALGAISLEEGSSRGKYEVDQGAEDKDGEWEVVTSKSSSGVDGDGGEKRATTAVPDAVRDKHVEEEDSMARKELSTATEGEEGEEGERPHCQEQSTGVKVAIASESSSKTAPVEAVMSQPESIPDHIWGEGGEESEWAIGESPAGNSEPIIPNVVEDTKADTTEAFSEAVSAMTREDEKTAEGDEGGEQVAPTTSSQNEAVESVPDFFGSAEVEGESDEWGVGGAEEVFDISTREGIVATAPEEKHQDKKENKHVPVVKAVGSSSKSSPPMTARRVVSAAAVEMPDDLFGGGGGDPFASAAFEGDETSIFGEPAPLPSMGPTAVSHDAGHRSVESSYSAPDLYYGSSSSQQTVAHYASVESEGFPVFEDHNEDDSVRFFSDLGQSQPVPSAGQGSHADWQGVQPEEVSNSYQTEVSHYSQPIHHYSEEAMYYEQPSAQGPTATAYGANEYQPSPDYGSIYSEQSGTIDDAYSRDGQYDYAAAQYSAGETAGFPAPHERKGPWTHEAVEAYCRVDYWRPPHAVVAFGFGGKLCSILPRKQRTLNVLSSPAHQEDEIFDPYKYNVGYAQITSVRDVVVQKENESANNRGLPARLSGRSAAGMVDVDTRCIGLFARAVAGEKIEDFAEALDTVATFLLNKGLEEASSMVRCIAEICKCNGKVAPKTGSPILSSLLAGTSQLGRSAKQPIANQVVPSHVEEVEHLVLEGRRDEAIDRCIEKGIWGTAILLSTVSSEARFHQVIRRYSETFFERGSPLFSLHVSFAGIDGADMFPVTFPSVQQNLQQNLQQRPVSDEMAAWRKNAAMLLANRTPKTPSHLKGLAECLRRKAGKGLAAFFCDAIADLCILKSSEEQKGAFGLAANRLKAVESLSMFCSREETLDVTNTCVALLIAEATYRCVATHFSPQDALPLISLRLKTAAFLTDFGFCAEAMALTGMIGVSVATATNSRYASEALLRELRLLDIRLRKQAGLPIRDVVSASASQGKKGGFLSHLRTPSAEFAFVGSAGSQFRKFMDRAVDRLVGEDGETNRYESAGSVPGNRKANLEDRQIADSPSREFESVFPRARNQKAGSKTLPTSRVSTAARPSGQSGFSTLQPGRSELAVQPQSTNADGMEEIPLNSPKESSPAATTKPSEEQKEDNGNGSPSFLGGSKKRWSFGIGSIIVNKIGQMMHKNKQMADLGQESDLYFDPVRKRWVTRGKEDEADNDPGAAPPPTSFSTSAAADNTSQQQGSEGGDGGRGLSRFYSDSNLSRGANAASGSESEAGVSMAEGSSGVGPGLPRQSGYSAVTRDAKGRKVMRARYVDVLGGGAKAGGGGGAGSSTSSAPNSRRARQRAPVNVFVPKPVEKKASTEHETPEGSIYQSAPAPTVRDEE